MLSRIKAAFHSARDGAVASESDWAEFSRRLLREDDAHFGSDRRVLDNVWEKTRETGSILTYDGFLARLFLLYPPPLESELSGAIDGLAGATQGLAALIRSSAMVAPSSIDAEAMKSMARTMRAVRGLESKVVAVEGSVDEWVARGRSLGPGHAFAVVRADEPLGGDAAPATVHAVLCPPIDFQNEHCEKIERVSVARSRFVAPKVLRESVDGALVRWRHSRNARASVASDILGSGALA